MSHYEGSPELGYASLGQVIEFAVARAAEQDGTSCTTPQDERNRRLGEKAFRQMREGAYIHPHLGPQDNGSYESYADDPGIMHETYETGLRSDDEELGDLINLDFLVASLAGRLPSWYFPRRPHFTPQVKPVVDEFIAERKQFLGIDETTKV